MKRIAAVLAFLVAVALSTASGVAATSETSTKTAKVKAVGLSLRYPSSWTVFGLTKEQVAAQQKALAKQNPQLAEAFGNEAGSVAASTRFHAEDLDAKFAGQPAGTVAVNAVALGGFPSSLDSFTSALTSGYEAAGGTVLSTSATKVGRKTAYRIELRQPFTAADGTAVQLRLGQLYIARGLGAVVVTVGVPDDDADAALLDDILRSVRRL